MFKIALLLILTLFCGLILFMLTLSTMAVVAGRATIGNRLFGEYVAFAQIALFAGYGFYAGGKGLLAAWRASAADAKPAQPGAFKPARTIGWILAAFGVIGFYTLAEISLGSSHPANPGMLRFVAYPSAFCLLGGVVFMVYLFRRPTP